MAYANFISIPYLYKHTIIDDNVDADLLTNFIIDAQDVNIQRVLGNTLYVKIMNDIASTGTTTGYYLTLLTDYIQRCQSKWVVYYAYPYINFRITNKAVSKKSSDNSQPTELQTIQWLRENVKNIAELYSTEIRKYIMNNQIQFPECDNFSGNLSKIGQNYNNYFQGIYTGKSSCGCGGSCRC